MAVYTPHGKAVSDRNDLCFNSPFMLAAACGDNIKWHDDVRNMCLNYGEDSDFGDTITLLCLIVDDRGWIVPASENKSIRGDVNANGEFNVADVVLLQKWLLAVPDATIADWKAADLCTDDILDIFDLYQMKQEFMKII